MIAITENKTYTRDEYFEREVASETRNEYRNGVIIPMTGGTPNHNDISGNLYLVIKSALRQKEFRVFHADQRLWIPDANLYAYPDVMVLAKPLEFETGRKDTVMNPCFMAEVLSQSTQKYDRGDKFIAYRTIPTFQEYLLIDQYQIQVEYYHKTVPHQWLMTKYGDLRSILTLETLGISMSLRELYDNIDLEAV